MERWVRVCSSFEEAETADREFWAHLQPSERVALVEEIRRSHEKIGGTGAESGRLRRVARVLRAT